MTDAIVAEGLVKPTATCHALDGLDLDVAGGHRAGPARAQRRRQDHRRAHPHHAARARRGTGDGGRARRRPRRARPAAGDRPVRAVRRGRRAPHRPREPRHGRPALPPRQGPRAAARAAELLEPFDLDRRRRPARQDLLRRHAPPARPRRRPGRPPAGAVPRRADHRPRPAQPAGHVGRHRRAGARRHDAAPDHAVPRGGRPAGRPDRGHRPRQGHRPGHRRRAQGPGRRRAARDRGRPTRRRLDDAQAVLAPLGSGEAQVDRHARRLTVPVDGGARRCWCPRSASSTPPASTVHDIGLRRPPSTTCSSPSPAMPPRPPRPPEGDDRPTRPRARPKI